MKRHFTVLLVLVAILVTTNSYATEQPFSFPGKLNRDVRDCQKENLTLKELTQKGLIDIGNWPFTTVIDDQVDLNNDGVCEIRIKNKTGPGKGGTGLSYYQKTDGVYKKIISIYGFNVSFLEEENGYAQVLYHYEKYDETLGRNVFLPVLLNFNGEQYKRIKTPRNTTPKYNVEGDAAQVHPLKVVDKRTEPKPANSVPAPPPQVINDSIVLELYDQLTSYVFNPPYNKKPLDISLDESDLWVAQEGGLLRFSIDQGTWLAYGKEQGFPADGSGEIGFFDHTVFASTYFKKIAEKGGYQYRGDLSNVSLDPVRGIWQDVDLRCSPNKIEQYGDFLIYGCGNGLWIYEPKTGNQKHLTPENSALIHRDVRDFVIDGNELITVGPGRAIRSGLWEGGGISVLELPSGQGRHFGVEEGLGNSFCSGVATTPGKIWVALYKTERGLNVYDREQDRWQLLKYSTNGIQLGGEKLLGIGKHLVITRFGTLVFLNTETLEAKKFTGRDGFPGHNLVDLAVGQDSLWVLMYSFLYDSETKKELPKRAGLVRFKLDRLPFPPSRKTN